MKLYDPTRSLYLLVRDVKASRGCSKNRGGMGFSGVRFRKVGDSGGLQELTSALLPASIKRIGAQDGHLRCFLFGPVQPRQLQSGSSDVVVGALDRAAADAQVHGPVGSEDSPSDPDCGPKRSVSRRSVLWPWDSFSWARPTERSPPGRVPLPPVDTPLEPTVGSVRSLPAGRCGHLPDPLLDVIQIQDQPHQP